MNKIENALELISRQMLVSEADVWDMLGGDHEASIRTCHQLARNAGWWHDLHTGEPVERDKGEVFTLIHSEITEGFEGWRKNLMDDKLPHRKMLEVEIADVYIRIFDACGGHEWSIPCETIAKNSSYGHMTIGELFAGAHMSTSDAYRQLIGGSDFKRDHLAMAMAMVMGKLRELADRLGLDVNGAMVEKLAFNINRADHKRENRLAEGGKKC